MSIALGGLMVVANLWPQSNIEAAIKDRLEVEMQRRACAAYRTLVPVEAEEALRQEQRESPRTGRRRRGATSAWDDERDQAGRTRLCATSTA